MICRRVIAGASLAALTVCAFADTRVVLRGGQGSPTAPVVEISLDGVAVQARGGEQRWIGWDRVREVTGERRDEAEPYRGVAELAWRARARLERGDFIRAEPVLEELAEVYAGRSGPTAAGVFAGLLRCRLARGAHAAAVTPWLEVLRLHEQGVALGEALGRLGLDEGTGLVPALPPIWARGVGVRALADLGGRGESAGRAGAFAALYRHAAAFEVGEVREGEPIPISERALDNEGVRIVWAIVLSRTGTPGERSGAREVLGSIIRRGPPPWIEAWCRVAIGRSRLMEPDPETRKLGVIELLHLPVRMPGVDPRLTGMAVEEAAAAMESMGDGAGAARLRRELYRQPEPAGGRGPREGTEPS